MGRKGGGKKYKDFCKETHYLLDQQSGGMIIFRRAFHKQD
jgi:hypothetical protein